MKSWLPVLIAFSIILLGAQIVRPFFNSFAWAAVIVITTWPLYSILRVRFIKSNSWAAWL